MWDGRLLYRRAEPFTIKHLDDEVLAVPQTGTPKAAQDIFAYEQYIGQTADKCTE